MSGSHIILLALSIGLCIPLGFIFILLIWQIFIFHYIFLSANLITLFLISIFLILAISFIPFIGLVGGLMLFNNNKKMIWPLIIPSAIYCFEATFILLATILLEFSGLRELLILFILCIVISFVSIFRGIKLFQRGGLRQAFGQPLLLLIADATVLVVGMLLCWYGMSTHALYLT